MQKVNLYSSSLNDLLCNGIVRKYQFKSPGRYHYDKLDAYLVDSEIYRSITYGIDNRDFFILDKRGFIVCPIKDIDCAEKAERDKEKHEHLNANDFKFEGMKRMQRGRRK